ncbi:MAG: alpha/beta hydrolase [Pseudonocardiaceae bacterium]
MNATNPGPAEVRSDVGACAVRPGGGHGRSTGRKAFLAAVGLSLALVASGMPSAAAAQDPAMRCQSSHVPVSLADGLPAAEQVFVQLCLPADRDPSTVQLLLHPVTTDHHYWDFPDPAGTDRYSYVSAAVQRGYATLAIDRIGIGQSSHPPSQLVGMDQNVWVSHQLVQALRAGRIAGPDGAVAFEKVIAVGHSIGAGATWLEASRYHDVDTVILSGFTHKFRYETSLTRGYPNLHPVTLDPEFGPLSYDPGYLTTRPGTRYQVFLDPGDVDPAVIARNEELKQTVTTKELNDFPATFGTPLDIRVPALIVLGDADPFFCGGLEGEDCSSVASVIGSEAPKLGPQVPCVDAFLLPGGGHDINLMRNAVLWFQAGLDWTDTHVGSGAGPAPGCPSHA